MLTPETTCREADQKRPPELSLPGHGAVSTLASLLDALKPVAAASPAKRRVGGAGDGGYVMLDDLDTVGVCYSLGIGPDVSWDLAMAERGATVYQYDHTVPHPPVAHPRFRHFRTGIAAADGTGSGCRRLDTLMRENGHADRDDMILKVDIEGHEWAALDALDARIFGRFKQVVVEFHGLRLLCLESFLQRAHRLLAKLRDCHEVIHLHGNNFSGLRDVRGLMIPDCMEVSFANRRHYRFVPSLERLPGPLDAANNPCLPDLPLDVFTAPPTSTAPPTQAGGIDASAADPRAHLSAVMADVSTAGPTIAVPDYVLAAARQEMDRVAALYRPAVPVSAVYQLSPALLDKAAGLLGPAAAEGLTWAGLRVNRADSALALAIRHLRERMIDPGWHWQESAASTGAVTLVTAALHFTAAWEHHPAFHTMRASAAASGFSLHGLAAFAAAHCTAMRGIPVSFDARQDPRGRIDGFTFATGQAGAAAAQVVVLDGWKHPSALPGAVRDRIDAARGRINERHPGMLVLSPGVAPPDAEPSLVAAMQQSVQAAGRKNKGLLAVAAIIARTGPGRQSREVGFGYSFMVVPNPTATRGRQPHLP